MKPFVRRGDRESRPSPTLSFAADEGMALFVCTCHRHYKSAKSTYGWTHTQTHTHTHTHTHVKGTLALNAFPRKQ